MLECRKSLYFCFIRGLHGILIGVVCSPNYSWSPSAWPPNQTCQTRALKIKRLAFLLPARHVFDPQNQLGAECEIHTSKCLSAALNPAEPQYEFPEIRSSGVLSPDPCSPNPCPHQVCLRNRSNQAMAALNYVVFPTL